MTNKKLSIIILFCDKDKQYIPKQLQRIKDRVKIPYEIILIDNCTELFEPSGYDYKYYSFGYNARQVQARKKGIELASGNYVWFVDADDEILSVNPEDASLMEEGNDIIVFNLEWNCNRICLEVEKDFFLKGNLLQEMIVNCVGVALWGKWIRTGILRQVEKCVPKNIEASALEDNLLVIGSFYYSKQMRFTTRIIYRYDYELSYVARQQVDNLDIIDKTTKGFLTIRDLIIKNFLKNEPRIAYNTKSITWYLSRVLSTTSQDLLEQSLSIFINNCVDDIDFLIHEYQLLLKKYYVFKPLEFHWLEAALKSHYPGYEKAFDIKSIIDFWKKHNLLKSVLKIDTMRNLVAIRTNNPVDLDKDIKKIWARLALEKSMGNIKDIVLEEV